MKQPDRQDRIAAEGYGKLSSAAVWQEVRQQFFATGQADAVQRAMTLAADRAIVEAHQSALTPVSARGIAVIATGSFARGELFPFSEVGILIIAEGEPAAAYSEAVAEFIRLLRERGMRPRHRISTVAECPAACWQDIDFATRLLDRKLLAGHARIAAALDDTLTGYFARYPHELVEKLIASARVRHSKYQNTPFHREPDVKETPGGLRDLQVVRALAMLGRYQVDAPEALGDAAAFLSTVRCFLHYRALEDRNVFDAPAQEAIAGQFTRLRMREYFSHARTVFTETRRAMDSRERTGDSLLESIRTWQSRFSNSEFTVLHGRVYLRNPGALGSDPEMLFRVMEFIAQHGVPLAPESERRLESARAAVVSFCKEPRPVWPALKAILSQPYAGLALRALQHTGLLSALFPEWTRIEGGLADPDRLYTVDEHTLRSIERVCELNATTHPARQRLAALLPRSEDQAVLLFALLFHHMGQSEGGPDPLGAAARLARAAAERVGMPAADLETLAFLIQQQRTLSDVVSGRDLDDPETLHALSDSIGTIERLKMLSALTYADIASTYPEAMLPLRTEQLWQAYVATERELTRELETDRIRELPASLPAAAAFIRGFPVRYLRARTNAEVAADTQLYKLSLETGVAVRLDRIGGAYRLTVIAPDRQALFASFAGAISSFGLDIAKAEAFSNSNGIVLDTFVFADPKRTLDLNPPEADRLQDLIRRVAAGKTEARRLLRSRTMHNAKTPRVEPQIRFDSEACATATLVEVLAEDRPGLLYSLANVFSSIGCNIDVVLIDTRGGRAIDVFYVTRDGARLPSEIQARLKDELFSACLGE